MNHIKLAKAKLLYCSNELTDSFQHQFEHIKAHLLDYSVELKTSFTNYVEVIKYNTIQEGLLKIKGAVGTATAEIKPKLSTPIDDTCNDATAQCARKAWLKARKGQQAAAEQKFGIGDEQHNDKTGVNNSNYTTNKCPDPCSGSGINKPYHNTSFYQNPYGAQQQWIGKGLLPITQINFIKG
jgi:hypothetical protein